jgi:hypothetical protein
MGAPRGLVSRPLFKGCPKQPNPGHPDYNLCGFRHLWRYLWAESLILNTNERSGVALYLASQCHGDTSALGLSRMDLALEPET